MAWTMATSSYQAADSNGLAVAPHDDTLAGLEPVDGFIPGQLDPFADERLGDVDVLLDELCVPGCGR